MKTEYDAIIIGAGAAGLFCASNIGQSGLRVLVLDHATKVGKKILMSGGGRCNFTNLNTTADNFTSSNPHYCKSALSQYTPYDFLALVEKYQIEYVEKSAGQLFCKDKATQILKMLLDECASNSVKIYKKCEIKSIEQNEDTFIIDSSIEKFTTKKLVIASGGLSIPTAGATDFGFRIARQFGHDVVPTEPALVPLVFAGKTVEKLRELAGISAHVKLSINNHSLEDEILVTHRGMSGPGILKISEFWTKGDDLVIDVDPHNAIEQIIEDPVDQSEQKVFTVLSHYIPKRLVKFLLDEALLDKKLKQLDKKDLEIINKSLHNWCFTPVDTEGYRTAEVTKGGVSTSMLSSKTMESKQVKGLYFIGEVVDVTGQLGGFNFQWAWSSAWCAAQHISQISYEYQKV